MYYSIQQYALYNRYLHESHSPFLHSTPLHTPLPTCFIRFVFVCDYSTWLSPRQCGWLWIVIIRLLILHSLVLNIKLARHFSLCYQKPAASLHLLVLFKKKKKRSENSCKLWTDGLVTEWYCLLFVCCLFVCLFFKKKKKKSQRVSLL